MTAAIGQLKGGSPSSFTRPAGVVDRVICAISGAEPSDWCPQQRSEIFASDQLPKAKSEDLWKEVTVDTWTGLMASDACSEYTDEQVAINVEDSWAVKWLKENADGKAWAEDMGFSTPLFFVPDRACRADDPRPVITLTGINNGDTIKTNPFEISGTVTATANFDYFRIEWGRGDDPLTWKVLVDNENDPQESPGVLHEWDLSEIEPGDDHPADLHAQYGRHLCRETDQVECTDPDADANRNAHAHGNADTNRNHNDDGSSFDDTHSNGNANADRYIHTDRHIDVNRDANGDDGNALRISLLEER